MQSIIRRKSMYHFVMNPTASSGIGREVWKKLKPILKQRGVGYGLTMLKSEESLTAFINALTGGYAPDTLNEVLGESAVKDIKMRMQEKNVHIVVLGGDGTLNLVLNAIVDMEHTRLSCIRVGSGNDFARNVGVEKSPEKALIHLLDAPEEMTLDYGEAEYKDVKGEWKKRRFIISSGIGYDADICDEVSHSRLKKTLNVLQLGKLVYVIIGIKQIFTRNNTKVKLYLDDDRTVHAHNLFFAVGMIHEMEGGGVPFCPHADPQDGMLDVCMAKGASVFKLLLEVAMVYFRKHLFFSNISEYRCKKIRIAVENPQWIHMDGETPCRVKEAVLTCRQGLNFVK